MDQIHLADVLHTQQHHVAMDTAIARVVLPIQHHLAVLVIMFIHAVQYQNRILILVVQVGITHIHAVQALIHLLEVVVQLTDTLIRVATDVFPIMIAQYIPVQDTETAQPALDTELAQCTPA